MRKSKFTESQVARILKEAEAGMAAQARSELPPSQFSAPLNKRGQIHLLSARGSAHLFRTCRFHDQFLENAHVRPQ
jgi:hypothetical protein